MKRSSRSVPTGPGSRGGPWHEREFRNEYRRRWRLLHPEYRERERLRRYRARHGAEAAFSAARLAAVPSAVPCACLECMSQSIVTLVLCGFCRVGVHA